MANKLPKLTPGHGIILEGSFERSFMYQATREGLATFIEEHKELDNDILLRYKRAQKRNQVLDLSLLYENIYLYGSGGLFEMKRLQEEIQVECIDSIYVDDISWSGKETYLSQEELSTYRLLKPITLPYLRRNDKRITSYSYDIMLELLATKGFKVNDMRLGREAVEKLNSVTSYYKSLKEIKKLYESSDPARREEIKKALEFEQWRTIFSTVSLKDDLDIVLDLLEKSANMSIPVASPLLHTAFPSRIVLNDTSANVSPENYYQVFQILLDEVEFFPRVNSLRQAASLRKDKRIVDFRENLAMWADALRKNNLEDERKLRKEVRNSNKALRNIKPIKKAGAIMTYIALPASIVPYLGLPLTVMSFGIQLYSDFKEWRNRWIMIGR